MDFVGRYEIIEEISRDVDGTTFAAIDPESGAKVAIKTLPISESQDPLGLLNSRLIQELKYSSKLSHPNIVTVHEAVHYGGHGYLVKELIEGITLERWMVTRKEIDLPQIAKLIAEVAAALDYAHSQAVVHRGLNPSCIILNPSGHLMVADFGTGKIVNDALEPRTDTGRLRCPAYYVSPEQLRNKEITGKSDQFSLAAIAHECITGIRPFQDDSMTQLAYQIVNMEAPLLVRNNSRMAPETQAVLKRALSKEPDDRYPTCAQFAEELQHALCGKPETAPAPVPKSYTPLIWSAVALISILGLFSMAWWIWNRQQPPPESEPAELASVQPAEPEPPKPYSGDPEGRFNWTGNLELGQALRVTGSQVASGELKGRGMPDGVAVTVEVDAPEIRVEELPSNANGYMLTLRNTSIGAVSRIGLHWRVKTAKLAKKLIAR